MFSAKEIITIFQNIRSMGQKKSFSTFLPPMLNFMGTKFQVKIVASLPYIDPEAKVSLI